MFISILSVGGVPSSSIGPTAVTGPDPHLGHLPFDLTQLVIKAMWLLVAAIPLDHLMAVALIEVGRVIQFMLVDGDHLLLIEPFNPLPVLP